MNIPVKKIFRSKRNLLIFIPVILITLILLSLQVKSGASSVATYTVNRDEFVIDIRERGDLGAASQINVIAHLTGWRTVGNGKEI